jgi:hypothetical protein
MTIAEKIAAGTATKNEAFYLLWLTLCELRPHVEAHLDTIDGDEKFDVDALLNVLDAQLGLLP